MLCMLCESSLWLPNLNKLYVYMQLSYSLIFLLFEITVIIRNCKCLDVLTRFCIFTDAFLQTASLDYSHFK